MDRCAQKKGGDLSIPPQPASQLGPEPLAPSRYTPAVVFDFAGKISLNAFMKRSISSGVPTETRRCVVIGGNGRPTRTPFFAELLDHRLHCRGRG